MSDYTFKLFSLFMTSSEQYALIASKSVFISSFQAWQGLPLRSVLRSGYKLILLTFNHNQSFHFILLLTYCLHIYTHIQVEVEATGEQEEKHEREETPETEPHNIRAPEAPEFSSIEDRGEDSPLEVHGDQAHPGSSTAGPQQHEERQEQEEESHEKPAGESHHSVSTEGCQDSSEHHEVLESQESPDTFQEPENKETALDGDIQVMAEPGEAAEEITQSEEPELGKSQQSEVQSQELEVPDIKQEHTE